CGAPSVWRRGVLSPSARLPVRRSVALPTVRPSTCRLVGGFRVAALSGASGCHVGGWCRLPPPPHGEARRRCPGRRGTETRMRETEADGREADAVHGRRALPDGNRAAASRARQKLIGGGRAMLRAAALATYARHGRHGFYGARYE